MNNIYLTQTKNFGYTNKQQDLPFAIDQNIVQNWVDEFGLTNNQTKDFTTELNDSRYRVHLFHSHRGWNAALRLLPSKILSFTELGIESADVLSISHQTGLTLFCGATGSGKSTTMNTVIDSLLSLGELGVAVSIEDPIEYLHHQDIIFQREVGSHCESFEKGLIDAMRLAPKTIIIGEIRDRKTAVEAVKAGLNGHRVLATLHAGSIKEAIARLWAFLDDQEDELLVQALQGIMTQTLDYSNNNTVVCKYEALLIDSEVKNVLMQILDKNNSANMNQLNQVFFDRKIKLLNEL